LTEERAGGGQAEILPATWRDLRALLELERLCFGHDAWAWPDVLASLTFPDTVRYKAVLGSGAVGFVVGDLRRSEGLGWIATLGVHPAHRRAGIGRRLLERCEEALGTPRIRLTLRPSNAAAYALYLQCGYRDVDRLERYYRDGEGAIVMEKDRRADDSRAKIEGPPPTQPSA
jgi:ribosomal protein S18 acetylase RimI-like enzyme